MENTQENKERFFSQYWGQEVMRINPIQKVIVGYGGWSFKHPEHYLELTPLSAITDEDAIEVAKLQAPTFDDKSQVLRFEKSIEVHRLNYVLKITHEVSTFHRGILLLVGGSAQNMYAYDALVYIDYLRSKGYALPWMGVSVQQQIEYGWVKLKEA